MPLLSLDERALVARISEERVSDQGNFLAGVFVGILLYGLSVHQAYQYIRSFPTDAAYIRLLVVLVMVLETLDVLANVHTSFHYLILAPHDSFVKFVWSLALHPAIGASIVVVSQIFFIRRVSLIGLRQRIAASVVAISLIAELGFSIAATFTSFTKGNPHSKAKTISLLSGAALAIAALADSALTVALIQAFRSQRAAEPRESEPIIDVVQLYIVNSGLATGTFNLIAFILTISLPPTNLLYAVFFIISVRLYANSLLAVLNSRELRGMEFFLSASSASVTLGGAQFADKSALWNVPRPRPRPLPRAAASRREKPQFTDPWNTATDDTKEMGSYFN